MKKYFLSMLRFALIATTVMAGAVFTAQAQLASLCITPFVRAQDYIPMLQEGNRWNVLFEKDADGGTGPFFYRNTHIYKLAGDTVIDGKQYAAIQKSEDREVSIWRTAGFIREDVAAERVYYRALFPAHYIWNDSITPECVLYDFGISVGDTVTAIWPDSIWNKVESIDSIEINGKYHKQITVGSQFIAEAGPDRFVWNNKWIEGIGNTNGILKENCTFPGNSSTILLAFTRNGETVYRNPYGYADFIWWTAADEPVETVSSIKIFASGKTVHIIYMGVEDYAVDVFSIAGTHLLHRKCNTNEAAVSLPAVPAGVYVVRITSGTYSLSKKIYLN
ncbi:MAG: T9SS type A sorting domain-containing protein [Tannerella sp.]|jgi:hypothetical protein|nr:T9SS type A sorting domain-containing protein [Tannerella sp.]